MKLRHTLVLHSLVQAVFLLAQDNKVASGELDTTGATSEENTDFARFEIPTLLNGSKIDPSPVTTFSVDLGDERATLKTGFQFGTERATGRPFSIIVAPYAKATNGMSTLFSKGKMITDFGADLSLNWILRNTPYKALDKGVTAYNAHIAKRHIPNEPIAVGTTVSRRVQWLALRVNLDRTTYALFDPAAAFDEAQQDRELGLGQVLLSYNYFFNSILPKFRPGNMIFSIGAGYASFTNYKQLDERVLEIGTVVYNADSSAYRSISETAEGRVGPFKVTADVTGYAEIYHNTFALRYGGVVRLGVRYTRYGLDPVNRNDVLSGGFFVTTKKKPKDGKSEDGVNLSVTLRLDQFQKNGEPDYMKSYAKVILGAALPLRFR